MSISSSPSPLSNIIAAKTYNAAWFSGSTKEAQITASIVAAKKDGALYVYVPANMLPYNASLVTFNIAVKMIREGGNPSVFEVDAYGAAGDGVTDDTIAITKSYAATAFTGGVLKFSPKQYYHNSNLVFAVGDPHVGIVVQGVYGATVLQAGPAVTIALTVSCTSTDPNGLASRFSMQGIKLNGAGTTGVIGLLVGDNASHISAYMVFRDVEIYGFHGGSAVGLKIKDLVGGLFDNVYVDRCTTNLLISASDGALPTVLSFRFCQFREADGNGIEISVNAYRVHFFQTVIEANYGYGVHIVPSGATNILWIEFDGLWMESNNRNNSALYDFHADGSAGGTVEVRIANANWTGAAKSIYFKNVHNFILNNIYPVNAAATVLIDTGCNGFIRNWPHNNLTYTTVVVNNSPDSATLDFADAFQAMGHIDRATGNFVLVSGNPNFGDTTHRFGKFYGSMLGHFYAQPTYGTTVAIDASTANLQQINVSDGVAFTISNPTSMTSTISMDLTIQIRNVSGGALGVITWGSAFKLAGAFTNPANGQNRSVTFTYDPGLVKWYETTRTAADVPN